MTAPKATGAGNSPATPGVWRRMSCWLYEGMLLFGVVFIASYLFSTLSQTRHALDNRLLQQAFLFVVLGIYFAWFWSKGQTLAMKTWHIRVVDQAGRPLTQRRALLRYVLSWLWFVPALLALSLAGLNSLGAMFGLLFVGVVVYAALSRLHPQRQFWHDAVCGTQLVTQLPAVRRKEPTGRHNPAP